MKIALITPAAIGARNGNRHTATRWAAMLRAAGHRVALANVWQNEPAEFLLALHARRSHESIRRFRAAFPDRPILLALTGTDVYRDIHEDPAAKTSLEFADQFIVLQPCAIDELPRSLRGRANVVYQSCASTLAWKPVRHEFRIVVIGNLRAEKDPMRAGLALSSVAGGLPVRVIQAGSPLDPELHTQARALAQSEPRYRWKDSLPHAKALALLATSHAMVISSRMEGGANVVSEAIRIGVPVLASRISGNIGLLGNRYPGYYTTGNSRDLARLITRVATDLRFHATLARRIQSLQPLVEPRNERRLLLAAVDRTMVRRDRPR